MKIYKFLPVYRNKALSVGGFEKDEKGRDRYLATTGEKLNVDFFNLFNFKINQIGKEYDLLANSFGWIIVSQRFIEVCNNFTENNIQFLEFPIKNIFSDAINQYYLLNILNIIDCVDMSKSNIGWGETEGRKYISHFYDTVFCYDKVPANIHLFRLKQYRSGMYISEKIYIKLKAAKITGFDILTEF